MLLLAIFASNTFLGLAVSNTINSINLRIKTDFAFTLTEHDQNQKTKSHHYELRPPATGDIRGSILDILTAHLTRLYRLLHQLDGPGSRHCKKPIHVARLRTDQCSADCGERSVVPLQLLFWLMLKAPTVCTLKYFC